MKTSNRKNLLILSFTLVVVTLGFGLVIPIIPFYTESMGAGGMELGLLVASYAVMRLVYGPVWGSLSDRIGRKPVLMIGVLGYGITMMLFGLATELWMLFVARSLSGILSSATSPTTMAYISDSTSKEDRSGGMGMLGAAVGLGTIIGPGVGGWLAAESLSTPFFIAGGMSFLSLLLIALLLPESLPPTSRRRQESGEKMSIFSAQLLSRALTGPLGILFFMAFLLTAGMTILFGIFGLYALEKFGYGPKEVGTVLMVVGLMSALAQGVLTGPLSNRWGEVPVIRGGLLASAFGFFAVSLANSYLTLLLAIGFFTLSSAVLFPIITALTSKRATLDQGITMGLSNSFGSLGRIAGPIWAGFTLDLFIEAPYWSGALFLLGGFLVSLRMLKPEEKDLQRARPPEGAVEGGEAEVLDRQALQEIEGIRK